MFLDELTDLHEAFCKLHWAYKDKTGRENPQIVKWCKRLMDHLIKTRKHSDINKFLVMAAKRVLEKYKEQWEA